MDQNTYVRANPDTRMDEDIELSRMLVETLGRCDELRGNIVDARNKDDSPRIERDRGILMVGMVPLIWTLLTWRWTWKLIMNKKKLKCTKRLKPHFMKVVLVVDFPPFYYY
jgi:hypothetical protein